MGKTLEVAADRAHSKTQTVVPLEYARGYYLKNIPSNLALKILHVMIVKAEGNLAEDIDREMLLSELKNINGMKNITRQEAEEMFIELRDATLTYRGEDKSWTIGGLIDYAHAKDYDKTTGDIVIKWNFNRLFREMSEQSNYWAILERQVILSLRSRYSTLLLQHIYSYSHLKYVNKKTFTIPELRSVLGVEKNKLNIFANFKIRAVEPAIKEINDKSGYNISAKYNKRGRTIVSVEISWQKKPELELKSNSAPEKSLGEITPAKTKKSAPEPSAIGLKFPETGTIEFSKPWSEIARKYGSGEDIDLIANAFREFAASRGMSLSVSGMAQRFETFCKRRSAA